MNSFKGRIALVTGGASGIGRALCEELGGLGASVVVTDIDGAGARAVADAIVAAGGRARSAALDVTREADVEALVSSVSAEQGRIDYMFNNAGMNIGGEMRDLDGDHWRAVVGVNLFGVVYGSAAAYRLMVAQGFGHIINVASIGGYFPMATAAPYSATKHAVVGLTAALAAEARDLGVHVSLVCPGFIDTGIFESSRIIGVDKEKLFADLPPRKSMVAPHDAARKILRGVARRKLIIVFPRNARILWLLMRIRPTLFLPIGRRMAANFRKARL